MEATTLPLDWDGKDGRRFVRPELVIIVFLGGNMKKSWWRNGMDVLKLKVRVPRGAKH